MATFLVRQNLTRGELRLFLSNQNGYAQDATSVLWTVFAADGTQVSGADLPAIRAACGEYYAPWSTDVRNGSYRISWSVQEMPGSPINIYCESFFVVDPSSYIPCLPPSGDAIPAPGFGTFLSGTLLGRGDLPLFLRDGSGFLTNAFAVFWTILDSIGRTVSPRTTASNASIGEYYAQWPVLVGSGDYTILWEYQQDSTAPLQSTKMLFSVINPCMAYAVPLVKLPMPSGARCCGVVVLNHCPPAFPSFPAPTPAECCDIEIARAIHLASGPLPVSGNYTNQPSYIIPQRIRHIAFYVTYTRGSAGGHATLRLKWGNGTEEAQETMLDANFTVDNQFAAQNLFLQDLQGPIPPDGSPIGFMIEAGVPGGATTVRLVAAESGVPGAPGTLGITLTASS